MAKEIIHRIGTTAEHQNFVGAEGEWTHDVDLTTIRVHDGSTVGGIPMARADGQNVGDFTVTGDLTVLGTTTTIESTEVTIEDKNITIAAGSADSQAADGGGFTIDGANVTFAWNHSLTQMELNRALVVTGYLDASGEGNFGGSLTAADIDTAGAAVFGGNTDVGGNMTVAGDMTVGGTFDCGTL